jgi:hypothetical protein
LTIEKLIDKVLTRYPTKWYPTFPSHDRPADSVSLKVSFRAVFRELIANAADASAKCVKIHIATSPSTEPTQAHLSLPSLNYVRHHNVVRRIVVHNDGRPFTEEDWNRLTSIADGNPDEESIGMFGLGFYSVFGYSDEPIVYSKSQTLMFKWKGKKLCYDLATLRPEQRINDTRVEMEYKDTAAKIPNLVELGQFLAASLASVPLLRIELWLNDCNVLSLSTNMGNSPIARTADIMKDTEHMEIQQVTTRIMQIHGTWLDAMYEEPKLPPSVQAVMPVGSGRLQALVPAGPESFRINAQVYLISTRLEGAGSPVASLDGQYFPVREHLPAERNSSNTDVLHPVVSRATVSLRATTANVYTRISGELASGIRKATKAKLVVVELVGLQALFIPLVNI